MPDRCAPRRTARCILYTVARCPHMLPWRRGGERERGEGERGRREGGAEIFLRACGGARGQGEGVETMGTHVCVCAGVRGVG